MERDYATRDLPPEDAAARNARFAEAGASVISDVLHAIGLWDRCLRLAPLAIDGPASRFAGRAVTLRFAACADGRRPADAPYLANDVIERAGPGDVIVMEVGGSPYAFWGDHMVQRAVARGVAGAVLDGAVRDARGIRELEFPLFGAGITPESFLGRSEAVAYNEPVTLHGVEIAPGDLLVGDPDGVAVVPRGEIGAVEAGLEVLVELEAWVERATADGTDPVEIYAEVGRRMESIGQSRKRP